MVRGDKQCSLSLAPRRDRGYSKLLHRRPFSPALIASAVSFYNTIPNRVRTGRSPADITPLALAQAASGYGNPVQC